MAFCNFCGNKLDDDAKVCTACGRPVTVEAKRASSKPSANGKRSKKKKNNGPVIAMFTACGLILAAIVVVVIVGVSGMNSSSSGTAPGSTDDTEYTAVAQRTIDLSIVEEELGDYDEVDTVTFTDKDGNTYTAQYTGDGTCTADLSAGDYDYSVTTTSGTQYTGTLTVPTVTANTNKNTGSDQKDAVPVDPTPVVPSDPTPAPVSSDSGAAAAPDTTTGTTTTPDTGTTAEPDTSSGTDTTPAPAPVDSSSDEKTEPAPVVEKDDEDISNEEAAVSGGDTAAPPTDTDTGSESGNTETPPVTEDPAAGSEDTETPPVTEEPEAGNEDPAEEPETGDTEDEAGDENVVIPEFVHFTVADPEEEEINGCTYSFQTVELTASSAADFPALASAVKQDSESRCDDDRAYMEENFYVDENTYAGEMTRTVSVIRADSTIVSVRYNVEGINPGAVHGFAYAETINFDPQTGDRILLSDLVKDTDKFITCMQEQADDYYGQTDSQVADIVEENGLDSLVWTMDYNGISVTFNTYDLSFYAAGPFTASFPFAEYPDLFDAKWAAAPDDYAVLLCSGDSSTGVTFDLGNDGSAETYDFYTLVQNVLPEFFGSYDEKYADRDRLTTAIYDDEVELTAVYGVKVSGNYYLCVFAMIPEPDGTLKPRFGTIRAAGSGTELVSVYTGDPVTLAETITDPSVFYVTDANGESVPAYISADGQLCLN